MYNDPDSQIVYQGDIVDFFVFSTIQQPSTADITSARNLAPSYVATPQVLSHQAIIVSQTCDISRRQYILLAPIFEIESYYETLRAAGKNDNNIQGEVSQLKKQKTFYYFYIPGDATRGVKEGYADLTFLNPFERANINNLKRIAKLDDYQRHVLSYKLGNLFMRPH